MNKRKFFLLPICLLLLGACNLNPSSQSKESQKVSEPEASQVESSEPEESSEPAGTSSECEHEYGDYVLTMRPTCTLKGEETATCSKCGATITREVAALDHDWDNGVVTTPATEEAEGVKTYTCKRAGCGATRTEAIPKAEGYEVTFVYEHCTIKYFKTQDYAADKQIDLPANNKTVSRNSDTGIASKYVAQAEGVSEVKPQVNFKVICESGYKVGADQISISGTKEVEWNNCKLQGDGIFRVTVIKADITITVTPVVDSGDTIDAAAITLLPYHCSIKVYVGPKNRDGGPVIDEGPDFYSRSKDAPYDYLVGDNAQFNFEVVPDAGYKFVDGLEWSTNKDGELTCDAKNVPFIAGTFNKIKKVDTNLYNLTKVTGNLAINIKCIPEAGEEGLGYNITFVTDEHCSVLVYENGQDYRFDPIAPTANKTLSRTETGDAAKYVAKDEGAGIAEVKPQVNFKIVCEDGYTVGDGNISVTGTYKNIKIDPETTGASDIVRITVIKSDLTITITSVAAA